MNRMKLNKNFIICIHGRDPGKLSNSPIWLSACVLSCFSHVWPFVTPWFVAHQTALFMGFSRKEYWSGLPCLHPGDLPDPGIEPVSLTSPALTGSFFTTSTTWEARQTLVSRLTPAWMTFNTLYYSHELVSLTLMIHEMSPWGGGNLCLIGCSYLQHLSVDIR